MHQHSSSTNRAAIVTVSEQGQTTELPRPVGSSNNVQSAGRRLLIGSGAYATTNFGLKAFNFLLIAVYTRYLSPSDYGTISLAEIIATTLSVFCGLGLDAAIRRLYFKYAGDPPTQRRYVSSVVRFGVAVTIGLTSLAFALGPYTLTMIAPNFGVRFCPYIALAISTGAANQIVDYRLGLYQSEQRPLEFGLLASTSCLLVTSFTLLLVVLFHRGISGMLSGKLIGALGTLLISIVVSKKWWSDGFEWKFVRESLPIALPIVPHLLLALGLVVADRFILEHYRDLDEVGVYSVAYTFGMVMYLLSASISQAWSPLFFDIARCDAEAARILGRLFFGLMLLLVGIATIGSLSAPHVVSYFLDRRYSSAGQLIPWIITGYLFHALYSILQPSLLQARRVGFLWAVSGVALVANVGLNILWIPRFGMYGAAYATMVAYLIEAVMMLIYAQRVYPLEFSKIRSAMALVTYGVVLWVTQVHWQSSTRFLLLTIILTSSLAAMGATTRNEFRSLLNGLRKREYRPGKLFTKDGSQSQGR